MPSDPPPSPPPPEKKSNAPLLVGGGTAAVATYSFGSTIWKYKWVIALFFILLVIAAYSIWKSFKADKPKEEQEEDD